VNYTLHLTQFKCTLLQTSRDLFYFLASFSPLFSTMVGLFWSSR